MERDLTSGSVFRNVIYFSLPYFLSYFLQTLYGMADLFIVGQFDGVASTTAVSIGSQVMHMLTVMIVGLAMGATVSIGQSIGAGDKKRASVFVGNTVTFSGAGSFASVFCKANCFGDVYACGGCFRDSSLSDDLFSRDSFYYGV